MNVNWPTNGSAMILNASAENGSLSSALRVIVWPLSGLIPCVSPTSSGEGRIIHHRVEQRLYALVLECRAHDNREHFQRNG